jgi:hypothetical protein
MNLIQAQPHVRFLKEIWETNDQEVEKLARPAVGGSALQP